MKIKFKYAIWSFIVSVISIYVDYFFINHIGYLGWPIGFVTVRYNVPGKYALLNPFNIKSVILSLFNLCLLLIVWYVVIHIVSKLLSSIKNNSLSENLYLFVSIFLIVFGILYIRHPKMYPFYLLRNFFNRIVIGHFIILYDDLIGLLFILLGLRGIDKGTHQSKYSLSIIITIFCIVYLYLLR